MRVLIRREPPQKPVYALALVVFVVLALGFAGCGGGSDDARQRAIEQSRESFETAVRQGHDIGRAPCIYYPNAPDRINNRFAIVVFPNDASPASRRRRGRMPGR